jgi:hypothetical protein
MKRETWLLTLSLAWCAAIAGVFANAVVAH